MILVCGVKWCKFVVVLLILIGFLGCGLRMMAVWLLSVCKVVSVCEMVFR